MSVSAAAPRRPSTSATGASACGESSPTRLRGGTYVCDPCGLWRLMPAPLRMFPDSGAGPIVALITAFCALTPVMGRD